MALIKSMETGCPFSNRPCGFDGLFCVCVSVCVCVFIYLMVSLEI